MANIPNIVHARKTALGLIEEYRVKAAPVSIDRIIRALGIKVQYAPLDNELSGMAFIRDGVPFIGVNSLHSPNRQRFTLAHELGHHLLHRGLLENAVHVDKGSLRRDTLAAQGTDPTEIEANNFAAELLMPAPILKEMLGGKNVDFEDDELVESLAKKLKVSSIALQFRLQSEKV